MGQCSRFGAVISLVGILGVQACGMGAGNTPPFDKSKDGDVHTGHPPIVGSSDIFLPYYVKRINDSVSVPYPQRQPYVTTAMIGVNPKNPTVKGLRTIGNVSDFNLRLIPRANLRVGEYNDSEFKVHNYRQTGMLYTRAGQFYMADFTAGENMAPMRVSSETDADLICNGYIAYHYPNQYHSVYLYLKPTQLDANGVKSCDATSAPRWYAIRVDDPEDKAPRALPLEVTAVVSQLYNLKKDAELRGFLVEMGGKLRTIGADFVLNDGVSYDIAPVFYSDGETEVDLNGPYTVSRQNRTPEKLYWLKVNDGFYLYNPETNRLLADSTARDAFKVGADGTWVTQYSDNELLITVSDKPLNTKETPGYVRIYRFPNHDGYAKALYDPVVDSNTAIGNTWFVPGGFLYLDGPWKSSATKLKLVQWSQGANTVRDIYTLSNETTTFNSVYLKGNRIFVETFDSASKRFTLKHADWTSEKLEWTSIAGSEYGLWIAASVYGHVYDPVLDENDLKYLIIQDSHKVALSNNPEGVKNELFVLDAATGKRERSLGWIKLGMNQETRWVAHRNNDIWARDDGLLEVGVYREDSTAVDKFGSVSIYYFDASIDNSLTEVSASENNTIMCGLRGYFPRWSDDSTVWKSGFNDKEQCE